LPDGEQSSPGIFTISLDFELIWGTLDLFGPEGFRGDCEIERSAVIDRLLELFIEFDVPATWCILGHLFLDHCDVVDGVKHPEIVRAEHQWCANDWFEHDPCGAEESAPLFLGKSLIEKIRSCSVPQEIGSHSFSHVIFGDRGCSRDAAQSELAACVKLAEESGIQLRSFAFPRNQIGHLDLLAKYGFACYRGPEPNWYQSPRWPAAVRRLSHLGEVITAAEPPVVEPEDRGDGLVNIPGSMIYFPRHGLRRYLPMYLRVRRAVKGLRAAARRGRIFHLWFHPTNLAGDQQTMDAMFGGLRRILEYASRMREKGQLEILTMGGIAEQYLSNRARTDPRTAPMAPPLGLKGEAAPGRVEQCAG
jgi:peptidoglycan/xylan/chitin deacetylase (PgdA/CDA1 family)